MQPGGRLIDSTKTRATRGFYDHPRDWRGFLYVYPVLSRRAQGLSIGVNLNPDKACNFDCIYCQVDRATAPRTRRVELDTLRAELDRVLTDAVSGAIFDEPEFAHTAPPLRRLNDIAFSGDGEPTTCPLFHECVQLAVELKKRHGAEDLKIILITDAAYLTQTKVAAALELLNESNGEIWAKLDAGTEAYFRRVNRPNVTLSQVIGNITTTARRWPVTIQSLFARIEDQPPCEDEVSAFCDRLLEIRAGGGRIKSVQVYTVARPPAEEEVTALSDAELDAIARTVAERTSLVVDRFYG